MSRRNKKIITAFIVLVVSISAYYLQAPTPQSPVPTPVAPLQPGHYRITHISDGDTFTVDMNGSEERIRLIGVDTPESVKPNSPVQCFGKEASDFTRHIAANQTVRLEVDPVGDNRDRYDRLLRYAYLPDGTLLNQKLIEEGYGFAYLTFQFGKQAEFAAAHARAQDASRGLWAICSPKLSDGRWRSNDLK